MKTDDIEGDRSGIEDRRGQRRAGGGILGGGGFPIPMGKGGKIGIPALLIMVVGFFLTQGGGGGGGGGLGEMLEQMGGGQTAGLDQEAPAAPDTGAKDDTYEYVAALRTLMTEYWEQEFEGSEIAFQPAGLVIFDAPTSTGGCGVGQPEFGPFYCPADQKMYIDFGFYEKLERQLGFSGDFAMAYVLAHEYGHHIQNLLGINEEVRRQTGGGKDSGADSLSVKMELQADCFAGNWAKAVFEDGRLESGDIQEAIEAAEAVGDDAIQSQAGGQVNQESFTHGTSAQRKEWFDRGYRTGDPAECDTFG